MMSPPIAVRRLSDHRLRDHDADNKLNMERALDLSFCVASRDGPQSCAGNVIEGKREAGERL